MIKYPDAFKRNPPAQFDGVFDWDYLAGAFPREITPTDWDGVVEIKGNFLVFETKDFDKEVDKGQLMALWAAVNTGRFTVVFIWGKKYPIEWERWTREKDKIKIIEREACNIIDVFDFCKKWADWADSQVQK